MLKDENDIGEIIVDSAIEVHKTLGGPGPLESIYEEALGWEMAQRGLEVSRQVLLPVKYKNFTLADPLRLDLLVNELVIVECKATTKYNPVFDAQLLTYLKVSGLRLGYVINFGETLVKSGVKRIVNNL